MLPLLFFWSTDLNMNQDIKTEINPVLNPRAPEGSLMGIPGIFVQLISMYYYDDS